MAVIWRVIEQFSHKLVSVFLSILSCINSINCALQSAVVLLHILLLCILVKPFSSSSSLDWDIPDLSHSSTQMSNNYVSGPQGRSEFISYSNLKTLGNVKHMKNLTSNFLLFDLVVHLCPLRSRQIGCGGKTQRYF